MLTLALRMLLVIFGLLLSPAFVAGACQESVPDQVEAKPEQPPETPEEQDPAIRDSVTKLSKDFLAACYDGKIDEVFALFGEELRESIDRPMMISLANQMRVRLGKLDVFGKPKIIRAGENNELIRLETDVMFEQGVCKPIFVFKDQKLAGFQFETPILDNWFSGVDSIDYYRDFGRKFIDEFLAGKHAEALAMCHPVLQKQLPDDTLPKMIERIKQELGEVKSIEFVRPLQEINGLTQKIYLYYNVNGTQNSKQCLISLQFSGMKAHFVGFAFKDQTKSTPQSPKDN
ncbi:MAG: hypothetical protein ABL888_11325 [Pirellulaceae bacterium]